MPGSWWQRIIDPEALRALVVLGAAFLLGRLWERYLLFGWHRWRGVRVDWCAGPYPLHVVLGWLTVDVLTGRKWR